MTDGTVRHVEHPSLSRISSPRLITLVYGLFLLLLVIGLLFPLVRLVSMSMETPAGQWSGAANFVAYCTTPGLVTALVHTVTMGLGVTLVTLFLAFILAYAFTHTRMAGKNLCRLAASLPLFVPSLFPALGLIYLLGSQGIVADFFEDIPLYGPLGIFLGSSLYALPHATLLLTATLRGIDGDLYLAARSLGAGAWRRFYTVTLPGARYGITSAAIVVFILTITDFGVPKVLGGNFSMLATEVYVQVVGLQNFPMGATVSLVLLVPALFAFALDRHAHSRQRGKSKGIMLAVSGHGQRDIFFSVAAWAVALFPLGITGLVVYGAFVSFWPYDLAFTLEHFQFKESVYGLEPFWNSLVLASSVAVVGTVCIFCGAYLTERGAVPKATVWLYKLLAIVPLGIPGTVLGLAYILAFNSPQSPMHWLAGGMGILVLNTIIHFFTVCHLNCSGSLLSLSPHYEAAGSTLGVPVRRTFLRVICPLQLATLAEVGLYLFVNSLTTISAVVFLYTPDTIPASISILHLLDTGRMAEASAMGSLILCVSLLAYALHRVVPAALRHWATLHSKRA